MSMFLLFLETTRPRFAMLKITELFSKIVPVFLYVLQRRHLRAMRRAANPDADEEGGGGGGDDNEGSGSDVSSTDGDDTDSDDNDEDDEDSDLSSSRCVTS